MFEINDIVRVKEVILDIIQIMKVLIGNLKSLFGKFVIDFDIILRLFFVVILLLFKVVFEFFC